ncbi:MAG: tetratricopeptide repeat protein, partial [Acidobacteriota bacterium]
APTKEKFDLNEFLINWQQVKVIPTFKLQYKIKKIEPSDRYELIVTIYQDSDFVVKWYIPIQVQSKAQQVQEIVKLTKRTTECRFEISFKPEEVLLDPNYLVPRRVPQFQKGADVLVLIDSKAFPLIFKKKDKESLLFLLRALELDDENAETHYLLGRAYKILNQQDKAKQFYSQAVSRRLGWYMGSRYTTEQLHVYSHWQLAQIFLKEGNYDLARKNLEALLQKPDIEGFHKRATEELKKLPEF